MGRDDFYWLDSEKGEEKYQVIKGYHLLELLIGILGEHCNHDIDDYFDFGFVRSRTLNEDVSCLRRNLGVVPVDYRR